MAASMRTCPTVQGSPSPLITHRIGVDVCLARQRTFFHKCHRCVYRGKPADWKADEPATLTIELDALPPKPAVVRKPGRNPTRNPVRKLGPAGGKKGKGPAESKKGARKRAVPRVKSDKVVEADA
jgi:hypothetical protein